MSFDLVFGSGRNVHSVRDSEPLAPNLSTTDRLAVLIGLANRARFPISVDGLGSRLNTIAHENELGLFIERTYPNIISEEFHCDIFDVALSSELHLTEPAVGVILYVAGIFYGYEAVPEQVTA